MTDHDRMTLLLARHIAGELTPAEADELQRAMAEDPALQQLLSSIDGVSEAPPKGITAKEEDQLLEKGLRQMRQRIAGLHVVGAQDEFATTQIGEKESPPALPHEGARGRIIRWTAAAAAVILIVVGGYWYKGSRRQAQLPANYRDVVAKYGTRNYIELPDGSRLWLNAGSKVRYAEGFATGARELTLTGEAYFDVIHNPDQPFIIHTGRLDVKVLGTSLNVRAYAGDSVVETTLIQGRAQIELPGQAEQPIVLRPGEKVTMQGGSEVTGSTKQQDQPTAAKAAPVAITRHAVVADSTYKTIIETSWVEDKLVFRNKPFREVAAQLERWYNIRFHFDNQRYLNDKLTGYFKDQPIRNVMDGLQLSLGFKYEIAGDSILIR